MHEVQNFTYSWSIMRSRPSDARRSLRQHASASTTNSVNSQAPGLSSRGFCRINAERKSGGGSMMHPNAAHVQCVQRKPSAGACSCLKLPEMG